jgi:hypothetical protein
MLERVPQRDENAVGVERLLEEVVRSELRGLDRGLNRSVPADHHDHRVGIAVPQPLERFEPVDACHLHIHEHEVRTKAIVFRDRINGVARRLDLIPLVLEKLPERLSNALLVIDDQNAAAHRTVAL